jgi:amino acid adenylation domain-containing protein
MNRDSSFQRFPFDPAHPHVPFADDEIEQSIPERFEQQVRSAGDRLAIKSPERSFTYVELNQTANRLARKILSLRGKRAEPIALMFDHGASILAAILAVLKTGKFYLVLDPTYPRERLAYMLADSGATLMIADGSNFSVASELAQDGKDVLNPDDADDRFSSDNLETHPAADALALLLYTSGSTGRPKGALHTHKSVLVEVRNLTNAWHISAHDRWVLYTSVSFAASVRTIYCTFLNGGSIYPYDIKQRGFGELPEWLRSNRITIWRTMTTTFRNFMPTLPPDLTFPDVRLLSIGGEPVLRGDVEFFNRHFAQSSAIAHGMGPTECFTVCQNYIPHGTQIEESKLYIGWPLPDKEILLLDESGSEVPAGAVGEICVRSRYLSTGYWNDPERTRAAFRPDPSDERFRIYHTGDLGTRAENGRLTHAGRVDFQVKIRGFRIEVAEIEVALRALDGVQDAVVVGREDTIGEKRLIAYFVPSKRPELTASQLRKALASAIPDYMMPSAFVCLDVLPQTPNGKTDRLRLPAPSQRRPALDVAYAEPRGLMEEGLSRIWSEVLAIDAVGVDDDFFDLGGDSLLATKIAARALNKLKVEVPLKMLFESPTIARLAAQIRDACAEKTIDRKPIIPRSRR